MGKHLDIVVSGRVQGVGFRAFVKRNAEEIGVKGTVKNHSDGTVRIEAEGDENKLDLLLQRCKKGPSLSLVRNLTFQEGGWMNYNDFRIAY